MQVDWTQIAESAIAILTPLAPYLQKGGEEIAKEVAKEAWEKGKRILSAVQDRFQKDNDETALKTLDFFLENPESYDKPLAHLIGRKARENFEFGKELETLVQQAVQTTAVVSLMNNFYGRVGKVIQIGSAGTVEIN